MNIIGLNENNRRVGQDHPKSTHPDHIVDKARDYHENQGFGYKKIAKMLGVRLSTVKDWLKYKTRAQYATKWKRV